MYNQIEEVNKATEERDNNQPESNDSWNLVAFFFEPFGLPGRLFKFAGALFSSPKPWNRKKGLGRWNISKLKKSDQIRDTCQGTQYLHWR